MSASSSDRPSVAVVGGGYAGIKVAKQLDDVAEVTLIDPKDSFVHNVAAWRALVDPDWLDRIFYSYEDLLAEGTFRQDRAIEVDGTRVKLESGGELEPDYLVLATGSHYPFPAKTDDVSSASSRERMLAAHEVLLGAERVLLIGAGPSGIELAGEIKAFFPEKHVILADVSDEILVGPFDQPLRDELRRQLVEIGVELRLGSALNELPDARPAEAAAISVTTADGDKLEADVWFRCFGVDLQTGYLNGGLDDSGYISVSPDLTVKGQDRVYALGDIADADRNMAGMAGNQATLVADNIRAAITGEGETAEYEKSPTVIAVPIGPKGGAGQFPGVEGVAPAELVSQAKGQDMLVDGYAELFDAQPKVNA